MISEKRISLIVAMSQNRVIGRDNQLPWKLSADLKRFKALTMGHALIMGRKTYDSIGRPLPGRTNIVVTRNPSLAIPGVTVVHGLREAMAQASGDEVFVIGGEQIFKETLPRADSIYLTVIEADYEGDTFFPPLADNVWKVVESERIADEPTFPHPYRFERLLRFRR